MQEAEELGGKITALGGENYLPESKIFHADERRSSGPWWGSPSSDKLIFSEILDFGLDFSLRFLSDGYLLFCRDLLCSFVKVWSC